MEALILYVDAYWASPWTCSSYIAACEKGVPFATSMAIMHESVPLHRDYRERSMTSRVPALQHGEFWLAESSAIVEYLDERFPPPAHPALLPRDVEARARARQLMAWLRSDLWALRNEFDSQTLFYDLPPVTPSPAAERNIARLLEVTRRFLTGRPGPYLFDEFCMADLDLSFALQRLPRNGITLPPEAAKLVDAVWSRPSMRGFLERSRPPHPDRSP
jgi:glutathione S-transferase